MIRPRCVGVNQLAMIFTVGGHPPAWRRPFENHSTSKSAAAAPRVACGETMRTTAFTGVASDGITGTSRLAEAKRRHAATEPKRPFRRMRFGP